MPNIGPVELIIILVILLLVFGPKRLPGLGKQLGTGMREFKESVTGKDRDDDDDTERAQERTGVAGLPAAPPSTPAAAAEREKGAVRASARDE
jgi:sec-independent protein translocase protein TatA